MANCGAIGSPSLLTDPRFGVVRKPHLALGQVANRVREADIFVGSDSAESLGGEFVRAGVAEVERGETLSLLVVAITTAKPQT
jgi:hypothetical protein